MPKPSGLCLCFLVTAACLSSPVPSSFAKETLEPQRLGSESELPPNLTQPVTYEVDFSAVVTPPYHADVLKVWMPLPQSDQIQQVSASQLTTFPELVEPQIATEPLYGNKFAYFEFHKPQGAQIIRHRFKATVRNVHWGVDPATVQLPAVWPDEMSRFRIPDPIAEAAGFQAVIQGLTTDIARPAQGLFAAMQWIDRNLTYDHVDSSLRADAAHAFNKRHGHCSDYHGLCATMGRTLGFPTRVTYGISLFPKNSPSHCKLEAYLPPYGWVSFDLSETQKMVHAIQSNDSLSERDKQRLSAAARRRLLAGFRENSWLQVTRGTDYELAPPASHPVQVVRTIYAEADGEALPEPDPANKEKREFSWMTVHAYKADQPVSLPFKDLSSLESE